MHIDERISNPLQYLLCLLFRILCSSRLYCHIMGCLEWHHYVESPFAKAKLQLPPCSFQQALSFSVRCPALAHIIRALPDLWRKMRDLNPQETIADLHVGFLDRCATVTLIFHVAGFFRHRQASRRAPGFFPGHSSSRTTDAPPRFPWGWALLTGIPSANGQLSPALCQLWVLGTDAGVEPAPYGI